MKDNRPVNLDLMTIKLPITAVVSILHRVSGVVLFFGAGVLLYMLQQSLASPESFAEMQAHMAESPVCKAIVWGVLAALIYHTCAGIKHLIMDMGIGESLEGGALGAKLVLVVSIVLMILAGVWLW